MSDKLRCPLDMPLLMIRAEIDSGKATVRSLGALYMVAMATRGSREGAPFSSFADINEAIMRFRCPAGTPAEKAMSLEPVKKVAWALYESVCHLQHIDVASHVR
jgi:hypothetical protein